MQIGGLEKLTLIDYPGKIACTVFLIGCNFRCPFCYSSELVLPEKIKKQPIISEKEFFAFLKQRKSLLEGVVICGGEPTIHKDLPVFIKKIKKLGFLVKLDTNGSNPEMLKMLISKRLVDYVAMDVKAPLINQKSNIKNQKDYEFQSASGLGGSSFKKASGVNIDEAIIRKSIDIIMNSGIDYEFRTTIVPGIHTKEEIKEIAVMIKGARKYYLQKFRPEKTINPRFEKVKPYPIEYLIEIREIIAPLFAFCQIR